MHPLLARLLKKRGVSSLDEVANDPMPDGSPTERQTLEHWQRVLSAQDTLDMKGLEAFCKGQIDQIESQMGNMDNEPRKNERLILLHTVYKTIVKSIHAPKTERESLEQYLRGLVDS